MAATNTLKAYINALTRMPSVQTATVDQLLQLARELSADEQGEFQNPMTTAGDIIVGGASGTPDRLAIGGSNTMLRVGTGALEYFTQTFSTGLTKTATSGVIDTITADLSTGIAGGQSVIGGTAASENLTLSSTSDSTKGKIILGTITSYFDEATENFVVGGSVTTGLPGGPASAWKLGSVTPGVVTGVESNSYVEVSIAGVAVKLAIATT